MGISRTDVVNQLVNFDGLKQNTASEPVVDRGVALDLIEDIFASLKPPEPKKEGQTSFDQWQEGVALAGSTEEVEEGDKKPTAKAKTGAELLATLQNHGLKGNGLGQGENFITDDVTEQNRAVTLSGSAVNRKPGDTEPIQQASLASGATQDDEGHQAVAQQAANSSVDYERGDFELNLAEGEKPGPNYGDNKSLALA